MIVVRNVFKVKFGKARDAMAAYRKWRPSPKSPRRARTVAAAHRRYRIALHDRQRIDVRESRRDQSDDGGDHRRSALAGGLSEVRAVRGLRPARNFQAGGLTLRLVPTRRLTGAHNSAGQGCAPASLNLASRFLLFLFVRLRPPNVALRQVLLDLACRPSDSPIAGVGSRSTPLRDIEGSVH